MDAPDDEAEKSHSFPGDWDTASSWSFLQAKMVGESSSDNEIHGLIRVSGGQHHGEQEEQEHRCHNGGLPPPQLLGRGIEPDGWRIISPMTTMATATRKGVTFRMIPHTQRDRCRRA